MSRQREQSGKKWLTFRDGFREVIGDMSDQSPVMIEIAAKPDLERVPMCGDGCPHIVTSQRFGNGPQFVEETNRAVGLDVANEMDAASRDRQKRRQRAPQRACELRPRFGALPLGGSLAVQSRRTRVVHVPLDEADTLPTDLRKAPEVMAFPKGWPTPQPIELFDLAVVLRLGKRQEDQFDSHIQTQPSKLSHHAGDFVAATEDDIVVEVQKARNAVALPGIQDMHLSDRQLFGPSQGSVKGTRTQIEGVESIDLGASFQGGVTDLAFMIYTGNLNS